MTHNLWNISSESVVCIFHDLKDEVWLDLLDLKKKI